MYINNVITSLQSINHSYGIIYFRTSVNLYFSILLLLEVPIK